MSAEAKEKGNAAFKANDVAGAIKFYSEALELEPGDHTVLSNR